MHRLSTVFRIILAGMAILPNLVSCAAPHGEEEKKEMGPVAFLWPPDREWDDAQDNTPPCGSKAPPSNRTNFPLLNGAVALTIADDAWNVILRISYKTVPRDIEDGQFATIQLEYHAIDDSKNSSQYACADITFVPISKMTAQIPCFNVTSEEFVEGGGGSKASSANVLRIGVTILCLTLVFALLLV